MITINGCPLQLVEGFDTVCCRAVPYPRALNGSRIGNGSTITLAKKSGWYFRAPASTGCLTMTGDEWRCSKSHGCIPVKRFVSGDDSKINPQKVDTGQLTIIRELHCHAERGPGFEKIIEGLKKS